jgi:hypothetical protein
VNLQPGDIVLTRSRAGWLGAVIRAFTAGYYNHVGTITTAGDERQAQLVEALARVRRGPLWQLYGPPAGPADKRPEIAVYRLLAPTPSQRCAAAAAAEAFVGKKYAWWELLEHAGDWWLTQQRGKETYFFRRIRLFPSREECSGVVEAGWAAGGVSFDVPPGTANPTDIHHYVQQPGNAELIFAGVLGEEA